MATFAQATYMGDDIIIECDSRWDCCQRQQAQYKVKGMNAAVPGAGVRATVGKALNAAKQAAQSAASTRMDNLTSQEQAEDAEAAGAAPCLVDQLKQGGTRQGLGLQMDHPLDVKLGGLAAPAMLTPLSGPVNNAFGSFAKNVGNRMARAGATSVKSISLVCPPSSPGCPGASFNEGPKTSFPSHWWKTEFKRMTSMPSLLVL